MQLYAMAPDGHKELIAWDAKKSVSQPFLVKPRDIKPIRSDVDYSKKTGVFKIEDVYVSGGRTLSRVTKGTVKKIRVVKLEYRHSSADANPFNFGNQGTSGMVFVPISTYTGSWQAKRIMGEAKVYDDGSAAFEVPAMEPLYFQLIDEEGRMIQTMRSWSTLMPGEVFNCVGCHEDKNSAIPDPSKRTQADTIQKLDPFYDITGKLFSYPEIIQPILDAKCVSCHSPGKLDLRGNLEIIDDDQNRECKKKFARSYANLTKGGSSLFSAGSGNYIKWLPIFSNNESIQPKIYGSLVSKLTTDILPKHKTKEGFNLTKEELEKIYAWIDLCIPHWGLYNEGYTKSSDSLDYDKAVKQRDKHEAVLAKNIEDIIRDRGGVLLPEPDAIKESIKSASAGSVKINRRLSVCQRKLLVVPSSSGVLKISDLRGRQLANIRIEKSNAGTSMTIPLPVSLSKGVYIARLLKKPDLYM